MKLETVEVRFNGNFEGFEGDKWTYEEIIIDLGRKSDFTKIKVKI